MTLRELGYSISNIFNNIVSYILDAFITVDRDFYDLEIGQVFILLLFFGVILYPIITFFEWFFGGIRDFLEKLFDGYRFASLFVSIGIITVYCVLVVSIMVITLLVLFHFGVIS